MQETVTPYGYIYKTINITNNKFYFGQHKGKFKPNYFGSGKIIKSAINKYGKENFIVDPIVFANNKDELNNFEKYYISDNINNKDCYNIMPGGNGYSGKPGNTPWNKNKKLGPLSENHKKNIGKSNLGKNRSDEAKEKYRLAKLGIKKSTEHAAKCRIAHLNKFHTKETKIKMSKSHKNISYETRNKLSIAALNQWKNFKKRWRQPV